MKNKELSEYDESVIIAQWATMMSVQRPELKLLTASLNGIRLTIGQATKAKRGGMLPKGYPDWFLPIRRGIFSGLYIELKKVGGKKPRPEQEKWLKDLAEQGFECYCCKGSQAAISTIESYLNNKP